VASADPTSYIPGVPLTIHLRVSDLRMRFIGLVLYATNNSGVVFPIKETTVGDFRITPGDEFQVAAACGGHTVTHTNANIKALHNRFLWSAPKGTGTVKFRVLIKQGEQNKGNFYWPIKELILTEGASAPANPTSRTVAGAPGMACADVCYTQFPNSNPYCDAAAMTALQSTSSLQSQLNGVDVAVRSPLLAACAYAGTPQVSADGFASFRSADVPATCPASYVTGASTNPQPDVCYTAPLPLARSICICTSDSTKQTANPYRFGGLQVAPAEPQRLTPTQVNLQPTSSTGGATRTTSPLIAIVTAVFGAAVMLRTNRSPMLVLVLLMVAVAIVSTPVHAHNYIKSVHRAYEAAVSNPCQARIGNQPHVQVASGQTFEIEWSNGHGDC
jgi:hypothetical protein